MSVFESFPTTYRDHIMHARSLQLVSHVQVGKCGRKCDDKNDEDRTVDDRIALSGQVIAPCPRR